MFGVGEIITGGIDDVRRIQAAVAQLTQPTTPVTPPPPREPAAERQLTTARIQRALAAAGGALPKWSADDEPENPGAADSKSSTLCGAATPPGAPNPATQAEATFQLNDKHMPPTGATIIAAVESFRRPTSTVALLEQLRTDIAACPYYTKPNEKAVDGKSHIRLSLRKLDPMPYPALGVEILLTVQASTTSVITTGYITMMAIGHNMVAVQFTYSHYGPPPTRSLQQLDDTAAHALNAVLQDIGKD